MAVSSIDALEARVVAWAEARPDERSDLDVGLPTTDRRPDLATTAWLDGIGTRSGGRHLEEWADPGVVEELRTTFARYDEADLWRATFATLDLFRNVAQDTAARRGVAHPTDAAAGVSAWLAACEAGRRA